MKQCAEEHQPIYKELQTAVRHTLVYGLGTVATKALGFLMMPFYTHYLSPADYGTLEILDLSISLFGMFLNMGITTAMLQAHAAAKTAEDRKNVASTAFVAVAATGLLTFFLGLSVVRPLSSVLLGPGVPSKYLLLSFSAFALNYISNLPGTYIRALEKSGTFAAVEVAGISLLLGLNIYFIAVLRLGLLGILLSSVIAAGLQAVTLSAWMLIRVGAAFKGALLRRMARYGLPLILSNAALFTLNFSDRFFLQHFWSLGVVGIYAVGYKFGFVMNYLLVQPFYAMWQSRMYIIYERPDHRKILGQIFVLFSLVLIYAALGLALLSPELVRVMADAKFAPARAVIPIVGAAYVFCGIAYCAQTGALVTGKTGTIGILSAATAVLNLVLNYILVPPFGMLGAAWATLLSFAALTASSYWFSQRAIHLPLRIGRVLSGILLAAGFYAAGRWSTPDSIVIAVTIKVVLLLLFPIVLWKVRLFSPAETEIFVAWRSSLGKKFRVNRCEGVFYGK